MTDTQGGSLHLRQGVADWVETENEIVVLDSSKSVYMSINESGARLWKRLAAGTTRPELADDLVEYYGIHRSQAEADVDQFLASLREHGLLATDA